MKKILLLFFIVCAVTGCKKKQVDLGAGFNTVNLQLHYYKQENQEGLKNVIDAFERANPDIKIELHCDPNGDDSLMSSRADVGTLPDILQMQSYSRIKEYASRGLIVDITREAIMTKVLPSALPAVSWNGKQYALPMDFAGIGIIYNKDIFSKLHIVPPETFEELKEVCKVLQDNGIDPFAALLKENWSMGHFITMIHTALMKERNIDPERFITDMNASKISYGIIDTDRLFEVLDFYRENLSPNGANMGGAEQQQAFASGKAAMMVQGLWAYVDAMKLNPNLNAGFIPFPIYNDSKMNVFYADVDSAFSVSSQSSKEKYAAAMRFMDWLASTEGEQVWIQEYKLISPFKGIDVSFFGGPYVDLMNSVEKKGASSWLFSQYPTEVFDNACKSGAQGYMLKTKTAEEVLKMIDMQWISSVKK